MRDVSRVVYDAALKRVRRAGLLAGAPHHLSIAERLTLAALGLDEPPTEATSTYTCECCGEQTTRPYVHPEEGIDLCAPCVASLPREGDVPPSEPPKAYPACDFAFSDEAIEAAARVLFRDVNDHTEFRTFDDLSDDVQEQWKRDVRTVLAAAVAVDGSGIDGGTAT